MMSLRARLIFSGVMILLLIIHTMQPDLVPQDAVTYGLLILAALPWIFSFISSAELPGGWKFEFRELQREQERQRREIESMRFLMSYFVTDFEFGHLQRLESGAAFPFERNDSFIAELRRLRSLGLIETLPGKKLADFPAKGDLRDYVTLTERGNSYLQLRVQWASEAA